MNDWAIVIAVYALPLIGMVAWFVFAVPRLLRPPKGRRGRGSSDE